MADEQRESGGGDEQEMAPEVAVEIMPVMRQDSLFRDASRAGGHGHQQPGIEHWGKTLRLAFQCVGVLYGDIGTSPLYVYSSTFTTSGTGTGTGTGVGHNDDLLGVLSLIIYSFILFTMVKYVYIALRANDDGDGGTFALYSLISRHAKVSLVPNQQAEDEIRVVGVDGEEEEDPKRSLSRRRRGLATLQLASPAAMRAQRVKELLETSKPVRVSLFLLTILATAMVISDACLTPAISVLSAVGGLKEKVPHLTTDQIVWMTVAILMGLFAVQRFGTDKVGYIFAPIVILWLLLIGAVGVYNLLKHDISVLRAFNPKYIYDYFRRNRKSAWVSLGGVLLCFTGTEALFADLGYFSVRSIQLSFAFFLVPSVLLCYAGQAAFLRKYPEEVANTFYRSTPEILFWPTFVLAILASIIGSQAMISCAFATISHSQALGCFPRVKILHTSKQYQGQVYIPEVNLFLAFAACVVTVAFKTTVVIGEAHGICVVLVMLITTLLLTVVMLLVWKVNLVWVAVFFLVFAASESVYLSSVLYKFLHGGYIPVVISAALMAVMTVWHYVHVKRYKYEMERAVSPDKVAEILDGAGDRLRKVPGVGLFYTELVQGIPPVFPHLIEKIPSVHAVLLFVSVKHLPVPHVDVSERFLFRQVGPTGGREREHRMYRCVARYGYRDPLEEARDFVASLVERLQYYIRDVNLYGVADVDARVSYPSSRCDSMAATSTRLASGGNHNNVMMFSASASYSELARARSTSSGATGRMNMMMPMPSSGSYTERQQQQLGRSIYAEEMMMTPAESFSELSGRHPALAAAAAAMIGSVNNSLFQAAKMSLEEMGKIQEEQRFIEREMEKGVVYIMGESEVVARPHSSLLKKMIVNYAYAFLRKNCRQGEKMLAIPRSQLLKVGMSYEI